MKFDLIDLMAELDGIANMMHVLSIVASQEHKETIGFPTPDVMQGALFSVARQTERVANDLCELNNEIAAEELRKETDM